MVITTPFNGNYATALAKLSPLGLSEPGPLFRNCFPSDRHAAAGVLVVVIGLLIPLKPKFKRQPKTKLEAELHLNRVKLNPFENRQEGRSARTQA
jgi:hypothetical protein